MRFIIDLYRYLVLFYCGALLVAVALAIFLLIDRTGGGTLTVEMILIGAGVLSLVVVNLGGIAILVSLHDRHVEVSDAATRIAASLEAWSGLRSVDREKGA